MSTLPSIILVLVGSVLIVAGIMVAPTKSVTTVMVGTDPDTSVILVDQAGKKQRIRAIPNSKGGFELKTEAVDP